MNNLYDAWLIQIDITNSCINKCAHCTRAVKYFKKPYFVDLDFIEVALKSLRDTGWEGNVGCMGGEPTIHPEFPEICRLYQKYFPKRRCGLWTCGGTNYKKYKKLIDETFGIICYNEHNPPSYHQPLLVASQEVVPDEKLRNELIDNCWLQQKWSPAITPKGAFFCEVAATLDLLFDGPGGYDIKSKWWDKNVDEFKDQRNRYCNLCSIAIPMKTWPDNIDYELISRNNAILLKNSPFLNKMNFKIVTKLFERKDMEYIKKKKLNKNQDKYAQSIISAWFIDPPDNNYYWYITALANKKDKGKKRIPLGPKNYVVE